MDAAYEYMDLADFNCSFFENASLSFLSTDGLYCNPTTDEIGTCWPRSSTGRIVERPCPAYINGVKYNTTNGEKQRNLLSLEQLLQKEQL